MKHLRRQCERLIADVAPELGRRVYVILRGDLPADFQGGHGLHGCVLPYLDLIAKASLDWAGRWHGRGPALLLAPATIARGLEPSWGQPRRRRVFRSAVLGVVLHEAAHILDGCRPADQAIPPPEVMAGMGKGLAMACRGEAEPNSGHGAPLPWQWHEWQFIRFCLHLAYRAAAAGWPVFAADLFEAGGYGLWSTWTYYTALGDEPARLADRTFAEIVEIPPPRAFADLWRSDLARWMARADVEIQATLARCQDRIYPPTNMEVCMFSELLEKLKLRKRERTHDFWSMARALARGESVKPEDAEAILEASAKTPDDLKTAVEQLQKRSADAAIVAQADQEREERKDIERKIADANAEFAAVQEKHNRLVNPLRWRLEQIDMNILTNEVGKARQRLGKGCMDETVKAELAEVQKRLEGLRADAFKATKGIGGERNAKGWERLGQVEPAKRQTAEYHAKRCRQEALAAKDLPRLRAEIATLEAREAELSEAMLAA